MQNDWDFCKILMIRKRRVRIRAHLVRCALWQEIGDLRGEPLGKDHVPALCVLEVKSGLHCYRQQGNLGQIKPQPDAPLLLQRPFLHGKVGFLIALFNIVAAQPNMQAPERLTMIFNAAENCVL